MRNKEAPRHKNWESGGEKENHIKLIYMSCSGSTPHCNLRYLRQPRTFLEYNCGGRSEPSPQETQAHVPHPERSGWNTYLPFFLLAFRQNYKQTSWLWMTNQWHRWVRTNIIHVRCCSECRTWCSLQFTSSWTGAGSRADLCNYILMETS